MAGEHLNPLAGAPVVFKVPRGLEQEAAVKFAGLPKGNPLLDMDRLKLVAEGMFDLNADQLFSALGQLTGLEVGPGVLRSEVELSGAWLKRLEATIWSAGYHSVFLRYRASIVAETDLTQDMVVAVSIHPEANSRTKRQAGDLMLLDQMISQRMRPEARQRFDVVQVLAQVAGDFKGEHHYFGIVMPLLKGMKGLFLDVLPVVLAGREHQIPIILEGEISAYGKYRRSVWDEKRTRKLYRDAQSLAGLGMARLTEGFFEERLGELSQFQEVSRQWRQVVDFFAFMHVATKGLFDPGGVNLSDGDLMVRLRRGRESSFVLTPFDGAFWRPETMYRWQRADWVGLSDDDWKVTMRSLELPKILAASEPTYKGKLVFKPFEAVEEAVFNEALERVRSWVKD